MVTLKEEYEFIIDKLFKASGISARFNAITLLEHFAGITKQQLVLKPTMRIEPEVHDEVLVAIDKMLAGYPLQYILGEWEFYGRKFFIGEGVLIPRQDTEVLIDTTVKLLTDFGRSRILDLCSGSGCIAVTLAKEILGSEVVAVELSDNAFSYLERNVKLHDCRNVMAKKGDALDYDSFQGLGQFDIIVANPPYIAHCERGTLQPELAFEPDMALYCDSNGLLFYEYFAKHWKESLKPRGSFVFEIGHKQGEEVRDILKLEGFKKVEIIRDLNGLNRVVVAQRGIAQPAAAIEITKFN